MSNSATKTRGRNVESSNLVDSFFVDDETNMVMNKDKNGKAFRVIGLRKLQSILSNKEVCKKAKEYIAEIKVATNSRKVVQTPLDALKMRLVNGEIDAKEYEGIKKALID